MKININTQVELELTSAGMLIYGYETNTPIIDVDEIVKMPLWKAMSIFGKYMHVGQAPLFKNNNIIIKED